MNDVYTLFDLNHHTDDKLLDTEIKNYKNKITIINKEIEKYKEDLKENNLMKRLNALRDEYKILTMKSTPGGSFTVSGGTTIGKSLFIDKLSKLQELDNLKDRYYQKQQKLKKLKEEYDDNILVLSIKDMEEEIKKLKSGKKIKINQTPSHIPESTLKDNYF